MRVDVIRHVFAHDQRVAESAEIGLQVGDRPAGGGVGQVKGEMAVQADDERRGIVGDRRGDVAHRLRQDWCRERDARCRRPDRPHIRR